MKEEEQIIIPAAAENKPVVFWELVGDGDRVDEDFIERHLVWA